MAAVAPGLKTPPTPPEPRTWDRLRTAKVRTSMHLLLPHMKDNGHDRVEVREGKDRVVLTLDIDNDGIGMKSVEMSLVEATALADFINRIRRKVAERLNWMP